MGDVLFHRSIFAKMRSDFQNPENVHATIELEFYLNLDGA